jgi:acyl-CoA synthetase (NDP forming)
MPDRREDAMQIRSDIESLFHPRGVALIGPVDRKADPRAVLALPAKRWGTRYHFVDPAGGTIGEVRIHERVGDVPDPMDLAVLTVGKDAILETVGACGARSIRNLIVSTSGFGEMGPEGAALEARLVDAARRYGMRVLGPNAQANMFDAMDPPVHPRIGKIALVTQSGHMGRVIFQASPHGVAFSRWVPTGNEADLEASDFIEYFAYDEDTAVIAGYFEGFRDGAKLRRALRAAAAQGKPVVVIKVGRQQAASRMASTHSAHLTGVDAVIDGLFRQYGVIRVDDVDELIETAALHAKIAPAPKGERVALYGISGGAVALMAEQAEGQGVTVPVLSDETQRLLHEVLPAHLGVSNPVDNGNLYRGGTPERRRRVFELMAADPSIDVLVCALTGVIPGLTDDFAADILDFMRASDTPVVVTWNTWDLSSPAYAALVASGVPIFRSFRGCFRALASYFERGRRAAVISGRAPYEPAHEPRDETLALRTLDHAESSALLGRHGIPLARERLVTTEEDCAAAAEALGFPVVMKALIRDVPHKTDAGLVRIGVGSVTDAVAALAELVTRSRDLAPDSSGTRFLVQEQVPPGVEVIVGVIRDPTFGAAVVVGLGGVLTEVLKDVSVRPLPITTADAEEMLRDLRGFPVLLGVRGAPPVDLDALVRVILSVAELAEDPGLDVVELDLNPVIAGPRGAVAVDSLIVAAGAT